jgi:hypothetical protein
MTEQIRTRALFRLNMDIGRPLAVRDEDGSTRLVFSSAGGSFEGARLSGRILPVTGDWVNISNSMIEIDVRVQLETSDGAIIYLTYDGVHRIDTSQNPLSEDGKPFVTGEGYFRVAPTFHTSDPRYKWLTGMSVLGLGTRLSTGVVYDFVELM